MSDFLKAAEQLREVWFRPPGREPKSVIVKHVSKPEELNRGLMFRQKLGINEGMLFEFPSREPHIMWMRDTFIPLDMIFIDGSAKDGYRVVGVVPSAKPLSEEPRAAVEPNTHVIEMLGGFCKRYGIGEGTVVEFGGKAGK